MHMHIILGVSVLTGECSNKFLTFKLIVEKVIMYVGSEVHITCEFRERVFKHVFREELISKYSI